MEIEDLKQELVVYIATINRFHLLNVRSYRDTRLTMDELINFSSFYLLSMRSPSWFASFLSHRVGNFFGNPARKL